MDRERPADLAILDADDVARLGDYLALVDALEAAHRQPPAAVERIVYGPDGHAEKLLALPAWQAGEAIGVKLVTVFPDNPATIACLRCRRSSALRRDHRSPLALIDGTELTYRKTAADSALGSRFLLAVRLTHAADGRRRWAGAAPDRCPSCGAAVDRACRGVESHTREGAAARQRHSLTPSPTISPRRSPRPTSSARRR